MNKLMVETVDRKKVVIGKSDAQYLKNLFMNNCVRKRWCIAER